MNWSTLRIGVFAFLLLFLCSESVRWQNPDADGQCRLTNEEIENVFDEDRATWSIVESVYDQYGLQAIVDCASEGHVVSLDLSTTVSPSTRIVVRRTLTIDGARSRSGRDSDEKAKLTCPSGEGLFLIEDCSFTLTNAVIENCTFAQTDNVAGIIEAATCSPLPSVDHEVRLSDIVVRQNKNPGGSVGLIVQDPACYPTVIVRDAVFEGNVFREPMSLSRNNTLQNVTVVQNENANGKKRTSFFHFPQTSASFVTNFLARRNDKASLIDVDRGNLSISGSLFANNDGARGGIVLASSSVVTVEDSRFMNNFCQCNGSAVSVKDGILTRFSSCDFVNNNGTGHGGSVYASKSIHVYFDSCRFVGSSGAYKSIGGAVYLEGDGSITSGAVTASQTARFTNCLFERSWAGDGATVAFLFWRGRILIQSCLFDRNEEIKEVFDTGSHTYTASGAVLVFKGNITRFKAADCTFRSNRAKKGGALSFLATSGEFLIVDSLFTNNRGNGPFWDETGGGAVLVDTQVDHWFQEESYVEEKVNLTISRSLFDRNKADTLGGAVHARGAHVKVSLRDSAFSNNEAERGGAVSVIRASGFETRNCRFTKNRAAISGGAVYIQSTEAVINSSVFVENEAQYGAGLAFDHSITIVESLFTDNRATKGGGAVHINRHPTIELGHQSYEVGIFQCRFTGNWGGISGGAVHSYMEEAFNIFECDFERNRASFGGALSLFHGQLERFWDVSHSKFSGNHASVGGAVSVLENTDLDKNDRDAGIPPQFHTSSYFPPGVFFRNTTVSGNTAELSGGGVFVEDPNILTVDELEVRDFERTVDCGNTSRPTFDEVETFWNNTVERGYEENLASIAKGICVTVVADEEPLATMSAGEDYHLLDWQSGNEFPTLQIVMYDKFGNAYARTKPRLSNGTRVIQPAEAFGTEVMAVLTSTVDGAFSEKFVSNDICSDVSSGEGEIRLGEHYAEPGNYSLLLYVKGYPMWNVTMHVAAVGGTE